MSDSFYEQETDLTVVLALAAHTQERTFVDVGAEKGRFSRALMNQGFRGVLCEPYPPHRPGLEALVSGTGSRILPFAIDETDHEGQFYIAVDSTGAAMDYFHSLHRDESHPIARHGDAIPVACRSLGSMAQEGLVNNGVGVLKIDTEGNDLKVILGMGDVTAEVLVCEFVTPSLYPTWTSSFPEGLVKACRARGYEECIAVKRFGPHEFVTFGPPAFVDGQWGNLIFTSTALLQKAHEALQKLARESEEKLVASCAQVRRELEEKETVVQGLAQACQERLTLIENLSREIEKMRAAAPH